MKPYSQISRSVRWKVLRSRTMPLTAGAKSHHIFVAPSEESGLFRHRKEAEEERDRLNAETLDPLDRFVVVRVITTMELDDNSLVTPPQPPESSSPPPPDS